MDQIPDSETKGEKEKMKQVQQERKCPECGGIVRPGYTELVYELECQVQIKDVPANVCSQCGEAFITGRVAAEVNRLVNRVVEDVTSFLKTQPQTRKTRAIAIAI